MVDLYEGCSYAEDACQGEVEVVEDSPLDAHCKYRKGEVVHSSPHSTMDRISFGNNRTVLALDLDKTAPFLRLLAFKVELQNTIFRLHSPVDLVSGIFLSLTSP